MHELLENGGDSMTFAEAIRKRINNLLKEKNMTIWRLYRSSGISKSTIYNFMSGYTQIMNLNNLQCVAEGFGLSVKEFFNDSLFDENLED